MSAVTEIIALVGSPNTGKTTLYNWLTGSRFRTVNYPGSTVDVSIGTLEKNLQKIFGENEVSIMDTPGTYSLNPKSADEVVTRRALFESDDVKRAILVADGTQLARHLLLAKQLQESGIPFVIAMTMSDLLKKAHLTIDKSVIEKEFSAPVIFVDGILGQGISELVSAVKALPEARKNPDLEKSESILAVRRERLQALVREAVHKDSADKLTSIYDETARIDGLLLHPQLGILAFFVIMFGLFSMIFWLAKPLMQGVGYLFTITSSTIIELFPENIFAKFLANGVIDGMGSVMVFVPQIFVLFLVIGYLESSGYLARAATLIDRPLSRLGMSGRSFVPLLSGFACAVPAMLATRNISSKRDRWITNFVIPLMTCSARLPVYSLLLGLLFYGSSPLWSGFCLAVIYLLSLVVGGIAAGILNRFLRRDERSFFMMELPLYRKPRLRPLVSSALQRTRSYAMKAGPVIFLFSVLIWTGTNFPDIRNASDSERLAHSYLAKTGQIIEPIFQPMGVDWRVGVGLLSAFAARETFVSSLALLMENTNAENDFGSEKIFRSLRSAKNLQGQEIFTVSHAIGLIFFFMVAMQCLSTFSVSIRELGRLKWAVVQLVSFNVIAYVGTVTIVKLLNWVGVA